jgi:hypothetical protein
MREHEEMMAKGVDVLPSRYYDDWTGDKYA